MTADEVWSHLPGTRESSVHLAVFPESPQEWIDVEGDARWAALTQVRHAVNEALEVARASKVIGAPLTAHVTITASGERFRLLAAAEADLPMLFIVSGVTVVEAQDGSMTVDVAHATGDKCPRCWRFVDTLAAADDGEDDRVCVRCADAIGAYA